MNGSEALRALLVEDDREDAFIFRRFAADLTGIELEVTHVTGTQEALDRLAAEGFEIVFVDLNLSGREGGMELLKRLAREGIGVPLVVVTGSGDEAKAVEAMKAGAYDYLLKDELGPGVLARALRYVRRRHFLEQERARMMRELAELSVTDELTSLPNRRRFSQKLAEEVRRSERTGHIFALLMADLDRFKRVNDEHGHQVGDRVLQRCAASLRRCLRGTDFIARYGGEEFCALLLDTSLEGAKDAAERLRTAVEAGPDPVPTVSIGAALWEPGLEPEELLRRADQALYAAKEAGRNRVVAFAGGRQEQPAGEPPSDSHIDDLGNMR
jgi:two-component system cell cycle response regulator